MINCWCGWRWGWEGWGGENSHKHDRNSETTEWVHKAIEIMTIMMRSYSRRTAYLLCLFGCVYTYGTLHYMTLTLTLTLTLICAFAIQLHSITLHFITHLYPWNWGAKCYGTWNWEWRNGIVSLQKWLAILIGQKVEAQSNVFSSFWQKWPKHIALRYGPQFKFDFSNSRVSFHF